MHLLVGKTNKTFSAINQEIYLFNTLNNLIIYSLLK